MWKCQGLVKNKSFLNSYILAQNCKTNSKVPTGWRLLFVNVFDCWRVCARVFLVCDANCLSDCLTRGEGKCDSTCATGYSLQTDYTCDRKYQRFFFTDTQLLVSYSEWLRQYILTQATHVWLPAGLRVAQPWRYCFYSLVQKWVFCPAGSTHCPDKREMWYGVRSPVPHFTFIGAKVWEYDVKISKFGSKFVPQGRLVCNIFTKLSTFMRVYR